MAPPIFAALLAAISPPVLAQLQISTAGYLGAAPVSHELPEFKDMRAFFDGCAAKTRERNWTWRFSMGPTRTLYYDTDISIRTPMVNVDIKNAKIGERHSLEYYNIPKNNNPLQFIDEPSNTFILTAENKKRRYAANLKVQHPKFLVTGPNLNTNVHVKGAIEGRPIDQDLNLNQIFSGYKMTKNHYLVMLGLEKIIPLAQGRLGALTYQPGAYGGVHFGYSSVRYFGSPALREPVDYRQKYGPIGTALQIGQRLIYHAPQDRAMAALSLDMNSSKLKYPFMDGTAEQDLNFLAASLNLGYRLAPKTKKACK